jgi:hypothetical protein
MRGIPFRDPGKGACTGRAGTYGGGSNRRKLPTHGPEPDRLRPPHSASRRRRIAISTVSSQLIIASYTVRYRRWRK